MRMLVDEVIFEDAQAREDDGKRVSQSVLDKMAYVDPLENLMFLSLIQVSCARTQRERNTRHASRARKTLEGTEAIRWYRGTGAGMQKRTTLSFDWRLMA